MRDSGQGGLQAAARLQGLSARCGPANLAGFFLIARREDDGARTGYRHQCPPLSPRNQNTRLERFSTSSDGVVHCRPARLQGVRVLQGCKVSLQGEPARLSEVVA